MASQAGFDRKEGRHHDYGEDHDAQHDQREQQGEAGATCGGPGVGLWRGAQQSIFYIVAGRCFRKSVLGQFA